MRREQWVQCGGGYHEKELWMDYAVDWVDRKLRVYTETKYRSDSF